MINDGKDLAQKCGKSSRLIFFFRDLSLFYYAMAADAGLEVGSFNMAWLCEENKVCFVILAKMCFLYR